MGMSTIGAPVAPQQPGGMMTQPQQPMTSQPTQFGNMTMGTQPNIMPGTSDSVPGQGLYKLKNFYIMI